MTIPDWLARHLETIGAMGPDRIGRAARLRHCKDCGRHILTGLDSDSCAGVAHVDMTPLAPLGEALALMADRYTYALHKSPGRLELQMRDHWQIAGSPAGTRRYDVVAAHSCEAINLPSLPSAYATPAAADLEHPPY